MLTPDTIQYIYIYILKDRFIPTDVLCRKSRKYSWESMAPMDSGWLGCSQNTRKIHRSADDWEREGEAGWRTKKCMLTAGGETGEEREKRENKSKKEKLLKMLSWKRFRWPLTSNKSSVYLNTEKSLLTSELIPATVTSKNNKAHKNIKVHPLQLGGEKRMYSIFQMKNIWTDWIYCNATCIIRGENEKGKKNSPSSTFPWKTEYNALFESKTHHRNQS